MTEQFPEMENRLLTSVSEALNLRQVEPPPVLAGPAELSAYLVDARGRLDRVEEHLSLALRIRATVQRSLANATATADDAWDVAITTRRSAPLVRGDEYSSARERYAEANLATLDARKAVRRLTDLASRCDEAVDVLRLCHRGLDGVRHDALTMFRALAFESHLER